MFFLYFQCTKEMILHGLGCVDGALSVFHCCTQNLSFIDVGGENVFVFNSLLSESLLSPVGMKNTENEAFK